MHVERKSERPKTFVARVRIAAPTRTSQGGGRNVPVSLYPQPKTLQMTRMHLRLRLRIEAHDTSRVARHATAAAQNSLPLLQPAVA